MSKVSLKEIYTSFTLSTILILIGVSSRILPHLSNMTALTSLSLILGMQHTRIRAVSLVVIILVISDMLLAYGFSYPVFGTWTLFTYSGFIAITLCAQTLSFKWRHLIAGSMGAGFGFWLWTNLGVWLVSYPKTWEGILSCYTLALPFLRNELLGDLFWMLLFYGVLSATPIIMANVNRQRTSS